MLEARRPQIRSRASCSQRRAPRKRAARCWRSPRAPLHAVMRATALLLGLAAAAALPLRPDEAAASSWPPSEGLSAPGAAGVRDEATLPTVTYIMPTNSRPEFVGHALGGIARQDYPAHLISEVVIVDDSPTHLAAPGLVEGEQEWRPPPDDGAPAPAPLRVVYVRTAPMSVGEKRNVAVGHARREVYRVCANCFGRRRLFALLVRMGLHEHKPNSF